MDRHLKRRVRERPVEHVALMRPVLDAVCVDVVHESRLERRAAHRPEVGVKRVERLIGGRRRRHHRQGKQRDRADNEETPDESRLHFAHLLGRSARD